MENESIEIPEYEGLYTITRRGVITALPKPKHNNAISLLRVLKHQKDNNGYPTVRLYKNSVGKTYRLHSLLASLFIPNPDKLPCVNHIDGDKGNFSLGNLEWISFADNAKHAYQTGLKTNRGENQSRSKLTDAQVKEIRGLYPAIQQKDIAKMFNMSTSAIGAIIRKENWSHI